MKKNRRIDKLLSLKTSLMGFFPTVVYHMILLEVDVVPVAEKPVISMVLAKHYDDPQLVGIGIKNTT